MCHRTKPHSSKAEDRCFGQMAERVRTKAFPAPGLDDAAQGNQEPRSRHPGTQHEIIFLNELQSASRAMTSKVPEPERLKRLLEEISENGIEVPL